MISAWASSSHAPRRSQEQSEVDANNSRTSSPDGSENRRRSSSDATPRQTPATTRFIASNTPGSEQDSSKSFLSTDIFSTSKRLGFFTDKLASSLSGTTSQKSAPRTESAFAPGSSPQSLAPTSISMASTTKSHTSPSKASYGRTYDSKFVSREMHRLGNLGHAPPLASVPSAASLSLPAPGTMAQASLASQPSTEPWETLHVYVLPLFNGEPLRGPIEDLNVLVKRHIQSVVSSSPSKALSTLESDAAELIVLGMVTLNAKLTGVDDEKLIGRVVEIWRFFWDQVLTYVEGALLPLQTDPLLSSLYRTPKSHRATSPGRQASKGSISSSSVFQSSSAIDVRTVALRAFRDKVIVPLFSRLYNRLVATSRQGDFHESTANQKPRLQQMLLVLSSQSQQRPVTFSLTTPVPQPTAGEAAISDLLRVVRAPPGTSHPKGPTAPLTRAPTFLSGARPRDRRGRIAQKNKNVVLVSGEESEGFGDETPRNSGLMTDVERERELLDALKSPDIDNSNQRVSVGGWGLGIGREELGKGYEEDDDEVDWDQAQVSPFLSFVLQPFMHLPAYPGRGDEFWLSAT
ncbi:HbrB-domain-containing protein [Pluteus cervinus]|uniref:HbrB-domain-containing protein n=1 Tax=Pluteus cervinus TaxID=181527 RepID=A0ACD3BC71_9AGAR|nr:HbrB-domain-containing protein [Pluteus cervinus]